MATNQSTEHGNEPMHGRKEKYWSETPKVGSTASPRSEKPIKKVFMKRTRLR
jgi:hypothetical protein